MLRRAEASLATSSYSISINTKPYSLHLKKASRAKDIVPSSDPVKRCSTRNYRDGVIPVILSSKQSHGKMHCSAEGGVCLGAGATSCPGITRHFMMRQQDETELVSARLCIHAFRSRAVAKVNYGMQTVVQVNREESIGEKGMDSIELLLQGKRYSTRTWIPWWTR